MKPSNSDPTPEFIDMLSRLVDGELSSSDREQLRQLLATDPECLHWYCRWMTLESTLHLDLSVSEFIPSMPAIAGAKRSIVTPLSVQGISSRFTWLAVACSVAVLATAILTSGRWNSSSRESRIEADRQTEDEQEIYPSRLTRGKALAVISRVAGVTPASARTLRAGSPVVSGPLHVDSGIVQLEFLSGANVIVEGPAELELVSSMKCICRSGKLRAHVPPQARGFTVETPQHSAVDLGTEFAVQVSQDQTSQIHVLEGEVELFDRRNQQSSSSKLLALAIGEAVALNPNGQILRLTAEPERFIGAQKLDELASSAQDLKYVSWRQASDCFVDDDSIIAYFDFQPNQPWSRLLRQVNQGALTATDGAIVGCRWAQGRWPNKSALAFRGVEDRVRLTIPGDYESVTLACWIQIGGFDRRLSSILLTDGHDLGEVHWQFTDVGELLLGVKADKTRSQEYISPVVLSPDDVGRWMHLACVYDGRTGHVRHYRDGLMVSKYDITVSTPLRFGRCELGNWAPQEMIDHRIRALNGAIDEFMLFNRPMNESEIAHLYEQGRPG